MALETYRLFGPNGVIWTSKITLHKRKFGRPSIRTVQNYGEEPNFGSLSKWTAYIGTFGHSPYLRCRAIHLDGSKITYTYRPNGRHFFVNLDKRPFSQPQITLLGSNFGPFNSAVVERNFGPCKIKVVDSNFGWSKILILNRNFGPSKITVVDRNFGQLNFFLFFFYDFSKWTKFIRKFGTALAVILNHPK